MTHIHSRITCKLGIGLSILLFFSSLTLPTAMAQMSEFQGLKIRFIESTTFNKDKLQIEGSFSTFVNCGSQYAIWSQFPQTIIYAVKDLETGQVYESIDNELSISWDGNNVYEEYSKKPCDQIVTEKFSVFVEDVYFKDTPEQLLQNIELTAKYFGYTSNTIVVNNSKLKLKKF